MDVSGDLSRLDRGREVNSPQAFVTAEAVALGAGAFAAGLRAAEDTRCPRSRRHFYFRSRCVSSDRDGHGEFAQELPAASVPILNRSSARISRAIKGEISMEDLKVPRRAKRNPA